MAEPTVNTSMPTWQEWQNRIYAGIAQQNMAPIFGGYNTPIYTAGNSGSSSGSSNSSTGGYESQADYEQRIRGQNNQRTEYVTEKGESEQGYHINMTSAEKRACIEQEQQATSKEHEAEHKLLASLGFSSLFAAPATYKLIKGKCYGANKGVTQLFYNPTTATLFETAPTTMINAQEVLTKASRQAKSALSHCKDAAEAQKIRDGYKYLEKLMTDALKGGNVDKIAKVTEQIRAANKIPYRKLARKSFVEGAAITKETLATQAAGTEAVTKAKAITGNSFVKKLGGKAGVVMGLIMAGLTLFLSKKDIEEAYSKDKETGKKQLWHSIKKAVVPVVTFTGGDALGKWLVTKIISKGAGKALGAAIGSCVPVLGTVAGLAIGCIFDWAVSKFGPKLIAAIKHEDPKTAYNSPVENARIESKTAEELFEKIAEKKMQNQELTATEKDILEKNKQQYEKFVAQVQAQLAQQQQQVANA